MQEDGRVFLHNHLRFTILYHGDVETGLARIVGFEVLLLILLHSLNVEASLIVEVDKRQVKLGAQL